MTASRYLLRSLLHHRYAYLGVLAGAVLGATVLLGALFAGDSVRASLRHLAAQRTGSATHVLTAGDRYFREALAADLAAATRARVAPVLLTRGTAVHATSQARANQVQLIGVTAAFWQFAPRPTVVPLAPAASAVAINPTLARRLNLTVGDTLIVRLQKPGLLAGNAPIAGGESTLQTLRCTVAAVIDDDAFGRFSLDNTQLPPASVFLPIQRLQEILAQPARANLLLIDSAGSPADLPRALATTVRLADYGLTLKWLEPARAFELSSHRIFIDPALEAALLAAQPTVQPVTSYLVNEFRARDRSTPYSIATATTAAAAPFLPADLGPREIVLNDWLARDLAAGVGDEVRLAFFQSGADGALVEAHATFRVRAITPLQGRAAERAWMPDFPGISESKSPRDWNPGLPLDLKRIRDQDERYWEAHRGTPKAFLSAAAGRELWATRWGAHTALRFAAEPSRETELTAALLRALRPEMNRLLLRDFSSAAADTAAPTVDFGGLFVGMSFFLILAALGLVAMLFQFCLLQRNREDALLAAVGLPGRTLARWRLAEGAVVLLAGLAAGLPLATLYTQGILRFLETIWAGGGGGRLFHFSAEPASITAGGAGFLVLSLLALWLALRRRAQRSLSIRLAAQTEEAGPSGKVRRISLRIAAAAALAAVAAIALSGRGLPPQAAFYLAGFALLVAGLAACRAWLARAPASPSAAPIDAASLGALNLKVRRSRSLTVIGLIATAVFMVLSVASFRKQVGADWLERSSGTGGFAFWVETTAALHPARDPRSRGFEIFESHAADLGEVVPLRAGAGDNANCFNLNTTARPQLLGVDAARLAARGAFPTASGRSAFALLAPPPHAASPAPIPALVDETTLLWALKRQVGDVLTYTDEHGRSFDVRLAGTLADSVFQGYLLIDETALLARFPSHPGYTVFLVDAARRANLDTLQSRLQAAVADAGGRVDTTRDLLASFHRIENTYIAIFNVLGALGVVLGSLGLAIVVARNLRERRGEFAALTALGLPRPVLARMVFAEFGQLVLWGITIGVVTSALAVWPGLTTLPAGPTLALVAGLLAGIVALNLACGWLVFRWSLRDLHPALLQGAE